MSSINIINQTQTKCGEIYYQKNERWCYLCVLCGNTTQDHTEFRRHFEEHLNECVEVQNLGKIDIYNKDDPLRCKKFGNDEEREMLEEDPHTSLLSLDATVEESKGDSKLINLETSGGIIRKVNISDNESESSSRTDEVDIRFPSSDSNITSKRPYKPRNKAFFCTYCKRTFRRRYQYNTHLNIHTGAKPHQCEICGRQFRASTTLQRHLNTHKQQTFICKHCNKSFTHRVALVSHETRHTQKRNEQCDLCEKSFYTSNQLDTHKRRVHKESNALLPFACDLCPNRYRSASMLSTHKCRKHLKTAKYQCEKCDKKFIDFQRLDEHKSIHFDSKLSAQYINVDKTKDI